MFYSRYSIATTIAAASTIFPTINLAIIKCLLCVKHAELSKFSCILFISPGERKNYLYSLDKETEAKRSLPKILQPVRQSSF